MLECGRQSKLLYSIKAIVGIKTYIILAKQSKGPETWPQIEIGFKLVSLHFITSGDFWILRSWAPWQNPGSYATWNLYSSKFVLW